VGRAAALLALGTALGVWYGIAPHLDRVGLWWSIAFISALLIPASFMLILIALPLWSGRGLALVALAFAILAFALSRANLDVLANFSKLAAMTFFAWWFLSFFEDVSWVVLVACLIPWVDAYSVWRGPTKTISEGHAHVFGALSVAFVVPGGGAARLGLPDVLFFAVFLAAAVRFRLRPVWTFVAMIVGLALTMILATWWDVNGLPALPGISLGFLLPNADLVRARLRRHAL
jgi:hypothetical protein